MVMHSATKYLNGHSDMVGGMLVVGDNPELAERARLPAELRGRGAGPFDSFLALRGLKTLALRMQRHCRMPWSGGLAGEAPQVEKVVLPRACQPSAARAREEADARLRRHARPLSQGRGPEARRFLENCELFALAESLGGVESLVEHPAIMTHASVPAELRKALASAIRWCVYPWGSRT